MPALVKLTRKIRKVQEALSERVAAEYRHPVEIVVREEPGPLGLKVVVACYPRAHPGTGMKKVLMDENGTTYGIHGEADLKQLFLNRGWDVSRPAAEDFLKLVNIAMYDGIGKFAVSESRWNASPRGVEFCYVRIQHPGGERVASRIML